MAGRPSNPRASKRGGKDLKRGFKKKPCQFCRDKTVWIDYKDLATLRKFMSDRGKIRARRVTGNCEQHQHDVAEAIKTARELVLLPYTQRTVTERPQGRRDRGDRPDRGERGERDSRDNEATDVEVIVEDADGDVVADEVVEVVEAGEES
jgi:small subunit ribosomal protein S18